MKMSLFFELMEIKDVSDDSLRFSLDSQPTRKKVSGELIIQAADSLEFSDLNEVSFWFGDFLSST